MVQSHMKGEHKGGDGEGHQSPKGGHHREQEAECSICCPERGSRAISLATMCGYDTTAESTNLVHVRIVL